MAGLFSRVAEPCGWLAATEKRKKKRPFSPFFMLMLVLVLL